MCCGSPSRLLATPPGPGYPGRCLLFRDDRGVFLPHGPTMGWLGYGWPEPRVLPPSAPFLFLIESRSSA